MPHVDEAMLVAYADDALSADERGAVEVHLVSCAECRARVEEERAFAQRAAGVLGFGALPEDVVVPPFEDVVRRSEQAAQVPTGGTRRRSLPPLAWAALLVVGLGAAWMARVLLVSPEFQEAERARTTRSAEPAAAPADAAAEPGESVEREQQSVAAEPAPQPQEFEMPYRPSEADDEATTTEARTPAAPIAEAPPPPPTDVDVRQAQQRAAAPARIDSGPPAAMPAPPPLPAAARAETAEKAVPDSDAVALDQMVVTGMAAADAAAPIDAAGARWTGTSLTDVAAQATIVRGVPDTPVTLVWLAHDDEAWRARVVQSIDGTDIEIIEWRTNVPIAASGTLDDGRGFVYTTNRGAPLLLRGALPLERLRALMGRVGPLR